MAGEEVKAGGAFVEVRVRDRIKEGLQRIAPQLQAFGKATASIGAGLSAAAAGAAAALGATVAQFSEVGDAIDKMAARTGLSTEAVSELTHAAGLSGTNVKSLETGLKKMQDTLAGAKNGIKASAEALDRIGLSAENLIGLEPDKQFAMIADKIAAMEDPSLRTAAAMDIFGKAGTDLIPLMAGGAKGIDEMRQQAKDLGLSMDRETTTAAAKLNDAMGTLVSTAKGLTLQIGAALAPVVTEIADRIFPIIGAVSNWIRQNRSLVVALAGVVAAVGVVGAALTAVGGVAIAASAAITSIGAIAGAVFTPLAGVVAGVALAIAGLVVWLYKATGGLSFLAPLLEKVKTLFGGLAAIISKGGISALGEVLQKAAAVLFSFMADVFAQWPRLAGYAIGRVARLVLDGLFKLLKSAGQIALSIGKAIASSFKEMIQSLVTGDIDGAVKALSGALTMGLSQAMQGAGGVLSGFQKQELGFALSERTRNLGAGLQSHLLPPQAQRTMGAIGQGADPRALQAQLEMAAHLRYMREQSMRGRLVFAR